MTEQVEQVTESQEPVVDYKELYEKTAADLKAVAAKKEELLSETKKAKEARREADEAATKAAQEKSLKDGEFEKLYQTVQKEKDELAKRLHDVTTSNRREKLQVQSMRIANDLADGDNAELLSDFVMRNLDKMADDNGSLTADIIQAVTNDFKANTKFKSLLRSSKATGGGATGNTSSAQATKVISREVFSKMAPAQQMAHIKAGGTLADQL